MNIIQSLHRTRIQISALERMMRTLRAEVETQISVFAPKDITKMSEIETGLGEMFASAKAMPPFVAQPYDSFLPGVWIGLDKTDLGTGATVALRTLRSVVPGGEVSGISRLTVNPVFAPTEKPGWVTLECSVDMDALRRAKGLRFDTICFFDFSASNSVPMPRQVKLKLRLRKVGGSTSDHLDYAIPVTTMPFEHSAVIVPSGVAKLPLDQADEAIVIFELPPVACYNFYMDHFSMVALEG